LSDPFSSHNLLDGKLTFVEMNVSLMFAVSSLFNYTR